MSASPRAVGQPTMAKADMAACEVPPPNPGAVLADAPGNRPAATVPVAVAEGGLAEAAAPAFPALREEERR